MCSKLFLEPYGIQAKIPTLNTKYEDINRKINGIDCIAPIKDMPFTIITAAIIDEDIVENGGIVSCEFTPMYSGIRVPTHKYGGLLFGNQAFNCEYKELTDHSDHVDSFHVDKHFGNNLLETAMAASGAAYSTETFKMQSSILGSIMSEFNPKAQVWGLNSDRAHEVTLTDGTYYDYTGILPLLARGCKKILSFQNCDKFEGDYCSFGLAHLFGTEIDLKCYGCQYRNDTQVFHVSEWIKMRENFEARNADGEFLYHRFQTTVMRNSKSGINGGQEVDIIFVPLSVSKKFMDDLPINPLDKNFTDIVEFPNIKYLFGKDGSVLELHASQINLLSTYTDWVLSEIIKLEPDFFAELL